MQSNLTNIENCVEFLVSKQFPSGNFPSSLENETDKLYHWCHGAPGAVHLMVKAYQVKKVWFRINLLWIKNIQVRWFVEYFLVCLRNISTGTYHGSLRPDAGFAWYLVTRFCMWVWIVSEHIVIHCPVCDTTQITVFPSYKSLLLGVWQRKVLECSSEVWRSSLEPWYFKERLWHMSRCFWECIYIPLFVQADRWHKVASSSLEGQFPASRTFITLKTS